MVRPGEPGEPGLTLGARILPVSRLDKRAGAGIPPHRPYDCNAGGRITGPMAYGGPICGSTDVP